MGWLGHRLRKPHADVNRTALEWNSQVSRRSGRPRTELERGEVGSEEQSSVAVCGGCPTLQIGVTGNID
jgi:hypothetical protein